MSSAEISEVRLYSILLLFHPSSSYTSPLLIIRTNSHPPQAIDLPSILSHNWKIQSCSAVTGENLLEGLDWVVNDVAGRLYYGAVKDNAAAVQAQAGTSARMQMLPPKTVAA